MEKKGIFTGLGEVISFTAKQNGKASGFQKSTVWVAVIVALIFALISILQAAFQDSDVQNGDDTNVIVGEDIEVLGQISKVYFVGSQLDTVEDMSTLVQTALSLEGFVDETITVEKIVDENMVTVLKDDKKAVSVNAIMNEDKLIEFEVYAGSQLQEDVADTYMDYVIMFIESGCYQMAGVTAEEILCMEAPYFTKSLSTEDDSEGLAVSLTEMFVPMIFAFIMYGMILMHGQSITKSVISEKASKLMEYLLTSIKPYALIFGKVIALSGMAVLQLVIWIVCGIGGYFVGEGIAESINPNYTNYMNLIIEFMANESDAMAFSPIAIVMAIVAMIAGFVAYCVLAALVASAISKIEDMSSAITIFQIPVIIGWAVAYIAPLMGDNSVTAAIDIIPVTSPFTLASDLLLGRCSILNGVIGLVVLFATIFVLTICTGKIYKGKVFNRK